MSDRLVGLVDRLRRGLAVRCALVVACRGRRGRASGVADLCLGEELCARAWVPCRLGKRALEVVIELLDTRRHEDGTGLNVSCALSRYLRPSPFDPPAPLTTTSTTTTTTTMRTTLAALTTAIFATGVFAQDGAPIVYDSIHNVTTIEGTWSSGSQHVLTGAVCDP